MVTGIKYIISRQHYTNATTEYGYYLIPMIFPLLKLMITTAEIKFNSKVNEKLTKSI